MLACPLAPANPCDSSCSDCGRSERSKRTRFAVRGVFGAPGPRGREREECRRGRADGWCDCDCGGDESGEVEEEGVTILGTSTAGNGSVVGERRD